MILTDFKVLSFDCYGTLVDWETGLLTALRPLLSAADQDLSEDRILSDFATAESAQQQATPAALYPDVLAAVHRRLAHLWSAASSQQLDQAFGASIPDWPAFPDSAATLQYLTQHYKLVILSNVDRASFAASNRRLQVEFDAIYTAEDIGSYKPDVQNFRYLIDHVEREFDLGRDKILHTAQSLFHDHVPAIAAGLATAWIDRRRGRQDGGATRLPERIPKVDFHFDSLADFVVAHRALSK